MILICSLEVISSSEKIITVKETIWLDGNGIVTAKQNEGVEFDEIDIERQFTAHEKSGINVKNKRSPLAYAHQDFSFTKEARELASKNKKLFLQAAIIGHSISIRLLVNFLGRFINLALK